MSRYERCGHGGGGGGWSNLPEFLVSLGVAVFIGSVALNWGMQLLTDVWVPLVIVGGVVLVLTVSGLILWRRWNRW